MIMAEKETFGKHSIGDTNIDSDNEKSSDLSGLGRVFAQHGDLNGSEYLCVRTVLLMV